MNEDIEPSCDPRGAPNDDPPKPGYNIHSSSGIEFESCCDLEFTGRGHHQLVTEWTQASSTVF
jgi:hypothetical protein